MQPALCDRLFTDHCVSCRQAYADYQAGRLGEIAGSEERYRKTEQAVKTQKDRGNYKSEL